MWAACCAPGRWRHRSWRRDRTRQSLPAAARLRWRASARPLALPARWRKILLDVFVDVSQDGHFDRLCIVADWQERDLDQAGFDRLNQPEICDDPRKETVGIVARAREVIGSCAEVVDPT